MSTRQIRKRVEKIEETSAAQRNGISPMAVALAQAFSPEELRALETKLIAKPGAVLTAPEMAELVTKLEKARQRPSCGGAVE